MSTLTAARVTDLEHLSHRFERDAAPATAQALAACAAARLTRPRAVLRYHDILLFMAAYPESSAQAALVAAELERIDRAAPDLARSWDGAAVLDGSGLAGVPIEAGFSLTLVDWLRSRFPGRVALAWDDGTTADGLDDLLTLGVLPVERDGRLHPRFDMRSWVRFASGRDGAGDEGDARDLAWVLDRLREAAPDPERCDHLSETIDLRVRWCPEPGEPTRTGARFPARPVFYQRTAPKRRFDRARLLRRSLPDPVRLAPAGAAELIDVARAVLAVRIRESDPVTYASPREVTLFRLERGIDIALFGMEPSRRLPLDSYFGYIAARNRVPVAYGGAWIMDRRAEVGINVFEAFRGGESAYLFGQILRTYRQHYGVARFQVDPYQFGADNPEAIRSGAFWFYHRFGFRPRDTTLAAFAADEWRKIRADRAYRTPATGLRRLTGSPLVLDLDPTEPAPVDPTRVGAAVTDAIRRRFDGDRVAARRWAERRVARLLPARDRRRWSAGERRAFERWSPLVAVLPGVDGWPAADRRALVRIMRAKGGDRERDHVLLHQRHERLREALAELEASVAWDDLPARRRG